MSRSPSRRKVKLEVQAPDETTEVFVVDARLRRIAKGLGSLVADVRPGIYKVRFRSAGAQKDRLVEVSGDSDVVRIHGDRVDFRSAAPIVDTGTSREYHLESAARESRALHAIRGSGSRLFVFVRDLDREKREDPGLGWAIHDAEGRPVAGPDDGARSLDDRFAALDVEVDPGTYRLRVSTGSLGTWEMFVVTRGGWQTQVFCLVEAFRYGEETVRRAALRTASILMARSGMGFLPAEEHVRLTELARQGLESGRNVVKGRDLGSMLHGKFDNPMLGVYGAHLLLLERRANHRLIEEVIGNLRGLVGDHPDVGSLVLRPGAPSPPDDLRFDTPPMLRSSWDLIVRASRRRRSLVPSGSLTDRVADGLLASGPWVMRRVPEIRPEAAAAGAGAPAEDVSVAEAERMLRRLVKLGRTPQAREILKLARSKRSDLTALEYNVVKSAIKPAPPEGEARLPEELTAARFADVMRLVDAPASSLARSIKSVMAKLDL